MALNVFKNITHNVSQAGDLIYTAPAGFSSIVLMIQVTNINNATATASLSLISNDDSTETFLASEYEIPAKDVAGLLTGKLVLEQGQSIFISGNDDSSLQLVMSILESQN